MTLNEVLNKIKEERVRQDKKWGQQNHPDGTGRPDHKKAADLARFECDEAFDNEMGTWHHILNEEFAEAMAESDEDRLIEELIQTAAVAVAWIEAIGRRDSGKKKG